MSDNAKCVVSPYLFGENLEHTRNCIHSGLSAEMLENRKFVGKPGCYRGCAAEWTPIGTRTFLINGNHNNLTRL